MPRYDDNQCDELEDAFKVRIRIIKKLEKELIDCRKQLNDALRYGFERNQENLELRSRIKGLLMEIARGINNGKDRVHSDK